MNCLFVLKRQDTRAAFFSQKPAQSADRVCLLDLEYPDQLCFIYMSAHTKIMPSQAQKRQNESSHIYCMDNIHGLFLHFNN